MFGYQFLNGCNPVLIQRCTKLPEKLPVTTEMVECSLERQLTLEQEVEVRPVWLGWWSRPEAQLRWLGTLWWAETTFCWPMLPGLQATPSPGPSFRLMARSAAISEADSSFPGHL